MNGMRKWVGFLMVLVFAAFALPASAATKAISLTQPSSVTLGQTTVDVTIGNEGNSNANSFEIDWTPSPGFVVLSGRVGTGPVATPTSPGLRGAAYSRLIFTQQVPLKTSVTITLTIQVTGNCAASLVNWYAYAWTGAPGPASTSFPLNAGTYQTSVPAGALPCTLGFVTQPTSADVNATITSVPYTPSGTAVKVGMYKGASVDTTFTGSIALAITPLTGASGAVLSGGASVAAVAGVATFAPSINLNGANYRLRASSTGYTSVDSNNFWITAADGVVNCSDSNYASSDGIIDPDLTYVDFDQSVPGAWGLRRGYNLLDLTGSGNTCKKVGVSLTLDGNVAEFIYDKSIPNQQGNFKYWIIWPDTSVNPDNTAETSLDETSTARSTARFGEKRPLVSWVKDTNGNQVYVPALNCASDDLTQGAALMPVLPNVAPFAGNAYAQYQYGTDPDTNAPRRAKACIAQHVMISSVPAGNGTFQVIYADKFVDRVDVTYKFP